MSRHLRLLAYLRWKYLWRTGGRSRRVGLALSTGVSLAIGAGLFIVSSTILVNLFKGRDLETTWELVHLAFAIVYVLWLYSGSLNDLYDPARLASFPLPPRTLFLGSTLSSFIGMTSIFGGALLAGFAVGIPGSVAAKVARGALFVALLVHLQMVSRLIRLTFLAVLTSRRWRDAAVLFSSLVFGGAYLAMRLLPSETVNKAAEAVRGFAQDGGPSAWFAWCPAVWVSWATELDGVRSAAGFAAFVVVTGLVYRAGGWVEERLAFSDPIFQYRPRKKVSTVRVPFLKGISRLVLALAGPTAAAVSRKETAVFFRDPAVRHRVLTSFFYILIPLAAPFLVPGRMGGSRALDLAGFFLIFVEMFFLTNLFGVEGVAVRSLLAFPSSRRHILLGKNLTYLALFGPFNALVVALLAGLTGSWERIPSVVAAHVSALLVVMALGNVTSIYFPLPFLAPGQRVPRRDENGCLVAVARSGLYLLTLGLLAPVVAVSLALEGSPWALAASLVGIAYAAGLYAVGLKISERALLVREEALGDYFRAA